MKKEIATILRNEGIFEWKMYGVKDYAQVMFKPGYEMPNHIVSLICEKVDCCSTISCVHSDNMGGYCLMLEFYR